MMGFIPHTEAEAARGGQPKEAVPDFSPEACSLGNFLQESFSQSISLFAGEEGELC